MKRVLSLFGRSSLGILIAALLISLAATVSSQTTGGAELKARKLAQKPPHTRLKAGDDQTRIEVKFLDGLRFDVNPAGVLIERPQKGLEHHQSKRALAQIRKNGGRWHRMAALSEEQMDEKRGNAQRKLRKQVADMNSYFVLTVPEGEDTEKWIDLLNSLPEVEIAIPGALPAPPPLPGNYVIHQGYLGAATGGIDAINYAWTVPGGTGYYVNICDFEYSWNLNHQDLPSVITLIPGGRTAIDPFDDNHGTAVLGELVSLDNGWGTTGIAYNAQMYVAPVNWDNGYNLAAAITFAMGYLNAGDIMLIEQQTSGPNHPEGDTQLGLVPSEWRKAVYDAIVTAVGNGIHVVEAAGNGSQNLDDPVYSTGNGGHYPFNGSINSGAIIVGAGARPSGSTTDRSRLNFSNYGSRVNVQGWGEGVMTTGYGTYHNSEGKNLWYRGSFGGTSSASPIVAGAVALIESIEEDLHSPTSPVSPGAMRSLLIATGSPQQAGINPVSEHIGPRPSILAAVQSLDPCVLTCPSNIVVQNDLDECGAIVNYPPAAASPTCGKKVSAPSSGSFFPVGETTVYVTTTSNNSCSFTVTVNDTQKPSITCPSNIVVYNDPGYCSALVTYSVTATDNCPGVSVVSSPPSGFAFPVGVTTVLSTATDAHGNTETCSFTVTVIDNEPPTITLSVSPDYLWPANHKMREITATVSTTDNCPGETIALTSITSNEPDDGLGDGDFLNDIQAAGFNTPDLSFELRAERSGTGTGRIYTVTYTVTDASSNTASASATVSVPHAVNPKATALTGVLPNRFNLAQNYPNPFNPTTMIRFDLPASSVVTLCVVDGLGREIAAPVDGRLLQAGTYEIPFDGFRLASGIYTYFLTAVSTSSEMTFFDRKKMILMK